MAKHCWAGLGELLVGLFAKLVGPKAMYMGVYNPSSLVEKGIEHLNWHSVFAYYISVAIQLRFS